MDLAVEFQRLKEGQVLILQLLNSANKVQAESLKVYTLDDLAKLFSVTKRTIYNWKDEGRLSFTCVGSKSYVTSAQLNEFLSQNEVKSLNARRF